MGLFNGQKCLCAATYGLHPYVALLHFFFSFLLDIASSSSFFSFFFFLLIYWAGFVQCTLLIFFFFFSFAFFCFLFFIFVFGLDVIYFFPGHDIFFLINLGDFFFHFFGFNWALFFNKVIWVNLYKLIFFIPPLFHSQPNKNEGN